MITLRQDKIYGEQFPRIFLFIILQIFSKNDIISYKSINGAVNVKKTVFFLVVILLISGCTGTRNEGIRTIEKKEIKPIKDSAREPYFEELLTYKADKDETLQNLEKKYNVSYFDIMQINGIAEEKIEKGQEILIPFTFSEEEFCFPMPETVKIDISSPFGMRNHPVYESYKFHSGVDIRVPLNTEIRACEEGIVEFADYKGAYGNYIVIDHKDGYSSAYSHMNSITVRKGELISKGEVIGYAGKSGNATGIHLHFELKKNGKFLNPVYYVKELKMGIISDLINGILKRGE